LSRFVLETANIARTAVIQLFTALKMVSVIVVHAVIKILQLKQEQFLAKAKSLYRNGSLLYICSPLAGREFLLLNWQNR